MNVAFHTLSDISRYVWNFDTVVQPADSIAVCYKNRVTDILNKILWRYDRRSRNIENPNSWLLAPLKGEGIVIVIEAIRFL